MKRRPVASFPTRTRSRFRNDLNRLFARRFEFRTGSRSESEAGSGIPILGQPRREDFSRLFARRFELSTGSRSESEAGSGIPTFGRQENKKDRRSRKAESRKQKAKSENSKHLGPKCGLLKLFLLLLFAVAFADPVIVKRPK